ncbi:LOW QUALITY PROTEIN: kinase suppressor of Ras 2-like [Amphiura filiformis]|uniref:LOW QUALITY PROTEIN: kinase suppressor of Ras 2-like n=1 Tax=Amphiura filiformis TaxID=82378 RepID=UPI003B22733C
MTEEYLTSEKVLENLRAIQSVIDGKIEYLDGMRKLSTSELQQYEKKTVEGKLIQLFGRQLAIKQRCDTSEKSICSEEVQQFPNLKKWLHVVDIHAQALQVLVQKFGSLSRLLDMPEHEVRVTAVGANCNENEVKSLLNAFKNLKKAYLAQHQGKRESRDILRPCESNDSAIKDEEVEADNQETASTISNSASESSSPKQKRPSTSSSISSADSEPYSYIPPMTPPANEPHPSYFYTITPPPTPTSKNRKPRGTPPPNKRALVNLQIPPDGSQLRRSRSSEAAILHRIDLDGGSSSLSKLKGSKIQAALRSVPGSGRRSHTWLCQRYSEDNSDTGHSSGHSSPQKTSPGRRIASVSSVLDAVSSSNRANTLAVPPRSPHMTRNNMVHKIKHRFIKKKLVKLPLQTCNYCHEKVMLNGFKCKDCKYVCHAKCVPFAEKLPSCGLPRQYEDIFKDAYEYERSGGNGGFPSPVFVRRSVPPDSYSLSSQDQVSSSAFSQGESSSNPSSTTSSTPSSPAPSSITPPSPALPSSPHVNFPSLCFLIQNMMSPENMSCSLPIFTMESDLVGIEASINSDTRAITVDSHDSQDPFTDSERTLPEKVESFDSNTSDTETNDQVLPRKNSKNLLSEWDIPYDELEVLDVIGHGRFGPVYRGKWHGDVAIKMLDIDTDNEEQMRAFRREVSTFKKTRHDFVVLFMGTCLRPPHYAIVTSLCKGQTLYTHLHVRKDRFGINKTVQIATQIAQGMGYLHAKGIVHKDLKSKNIFIENGKLVITDFALFSIARLSRENRRGDCMVIPNGWLGYLAPELIVNLRIGTEGNTDMELPFSGSTDVYAFGTIWYELLAGEMPFLKMMAETIIWRVGKGMKQSLTQLQASRDLKDILMMCWMYGSESRPDFSKIKQTLNRLPKKRGGLHRSPSHPLHLSRSAESIL